MNARSLLIPFAMIATLALATSAAAVVDPEILCRRAQFKAAGDYAACQAKVMGNFANAYASKCRMGYLADWAKIQTKHAGTSCGGPRFVDNSDGTVTDNMTALTWQQTTDNILDDELTDKDREFRWSANGSFRGDGDAFTVFLAGLNTPGSCLGNHCDWRMPTIYEIQTLFNQPDPCTSLPCIDTAFFGPVNTSYILWSSTTSRVTSDAAWFISANGGMGANTKTLLHSVRAVRGGL